MNRGTFDSLFRQCEKFYLQHPLKDSFYCFIAPSELTDFLLFLKEWKSKANTTVQNLVLADYISKTAWIHKPLTVYVMTETQIKESIGYNQGGITLEEFLKKFQYPTTKTNKSLSSGT